MKNSFLGLLFCFIFSTMGCSLYQSEARKLIANGTIDTSKQNIFYIQDHMICYSSPATPEYLKLPLEVVTDYESIGYAVYEDKNNNWTAIYRKEESLKTHFSCEQQYPSSQEFKAKKDQDHRQGIQIIDEQLGL